MEQEQDTLWTRSIEHINTQRRGIGQQTLRLEHPNSIQLMGHYLKITSQADMHKQTVYWKQWPSLKSPTQVSLKTHVLKLWKSFSKHEWIN
uniref:PB1-F2 protein n=1 Tax=Influenza A virus (A/chicken/Israel/1040/2007(H9N2)) TaxID=644024 RepID=C4RSJ3_9INFA|nr:PB1-F2 protein [Influenza A virus (A/chicken/Israel/1040/2007(H9N2))]